MGPDVTGRGLQQVQHEAGRSCYGAQHAEGGDTTRREIQRAQTSMGAGFGGRKLRQAETLTGVNFSGRRRQSAQTSAGADVSGRNSSARARRRARAPTGADVNWSRAARHADRLTIRLPRRPLGAERALLAEKTPRRTNKGCSNRLPRFTMCAPRSHCSPRWTRRRSLRQLFKKPDGPPS